MAKVYLFFRHRLVKEIFKMKKYEEPIFELINIKCNDIVLASGDGDFYEDIWDRDW